MATNLPENVTFDKLVQFDKVATEIHQTFESLINQLIARRDALLQRAHELREDYRNQEATRIAAIEELERVQQEISIKANSNIEFHEQVNQAYKQGLRKHAPSATFLCPVFRCQRNDTFLQLISELGEIVPCVVPDYSLKKEPQLTALKRGNGANEIYTPRGIAFNEFTELMYIADCWNSRIQIATSLKGEFVSQFRNEKLMNPWGIAVDKQSIFVTDICHNALFQFKKKNFKEINRTGTRGNKEGELNRPHGVCVDTNGDVFVADCANHRLSIFSKLLKFKTCIGVGQLCQPQDVKLSADRIVVLDWSPKCVHFFSREGHLLSSCVCLVTDPETRDCLVTDPYFFCLDAADNIIISDWKHDVIKIFTESGDHIHTLGRGGRGKRRVDRSSWGLYN